MTREPRTARQLRADDTRARLFAAAAAAFTERGYNETTVDEIARRAGVAKGTFFVHFASKASVVIELVKIQTRATERARARALESGGSPVDALRATVLMLGEQAGASRELSRAVLAAGLMSREVGGATDALFGEVYKQMIADAREAQRRKLVAAKLDPETVASALMASYLGAALHFTSSPRSKELMVVLRPLVEANLDGFRRTSSKEGSDAPKRRVSRSSARR
ncbi:MAG TPA: TetR/AcrR family transcriptional regulator [Polyangia bacterium]|nr:TetR/AcrR family transcriptional regulator [Polyangia bacterium]